MVFRLIIITCLFFYYCSIPNGRSEVYSYKIKQFVNSWQSNQTIQYPADEFEIQALIKHAYQQGSTIIRVIGSGHSYEKAISDEQDINAEQKLMLVSLEKYHGVTIDKENNVAIVKAGTFIGPNPEVGNKDIKKSLVWILNQVGYAVPDLAGITRQTVAGFLSTGSSGGSLLYSFYDVLVGIRLIDGKGTIHNIYKQDSKFHAVGISMGLFGIITSVNISLMTKSFYVDGSETISPIVPPSSNFSVGCPIDIFGDGNQQYPSLTKFFKTGADFSRLIWYPQKDVDRSVIWKASKYDRKPFPPIVPYQQFSETNLTAVSMQIADAFTIMNMLAADTEEYYSLVNSIFDQLQPIGKQEFFDIYYNSLPMDNHLSFKILPISFTELWIPIEKTKEVMNILRNYYLTHGVNATGNNALEIYTSGKSHFWLSPSYSTDAVRFDWYWFDNNPIGTAQNFFQQFWDLLKPFEYRCHWGKYLPDDYNGHRLHKLYPMLEEWLKIRNEMDPEQVFVTSYWRKIFSIKKLEK
ncbi:unnamed protein product [Rotaria sp. Silwood2]|nr:unnamed protein product [Rotaria sp. Silwood2]CAF4042759.1 unnamed protein product [Rotaria sp. Silwood2]